jgi:hypothetical protein
MQRSTSWSRPIRGSTSPFADFAFRSTQYLASADSFCSASGARPADRLRLVLAFGGAGDGARFAVGRILGDAMGDEVDRVVAGHVLFLQEVGCVRFPFGEDRDEHVGARHLGPAGGLHVDRRALDDALEGGGRHRLGPFDIGDEGRQVILDEVDQRGAQFLKIDAARLHDLLCVRLIDQRQKKMFERGKLVPPGVGIRQRRVNGLLKCVRKRWHARAPFGDIEGVRAAPRSWPHGIKLWFLSASFKLFLNKFRWTGAFRHNPLVSLAAAKKWAVRDRGDFLGRIRTFRNVLAPTNFRKHVGVCRRLHI